MRGIQGPSRRQTRCTTRWHHVWLGLSRAILDAKGSLSLSFFGASPMIESMERPASLAVGLGHSLRLGRSLSGGVAAGLTESSPDLSVYFGWSLTVR